MSPSEDSNNTHVTIGDLQFCHLPDRLQSAVRLQMDHEILICLGPDGTMVRRGQSASSEPSEPTRSAIQNTHANKAKSMHFPVTELTRVAIATRSRTWPRLAIGFELGLQRPRTSPRRL